MPETETMRRIDALLLSLYDLVEAPRPLKKQTVAEVSERLATAWEEHREEVENEAAKARNAPTPPAYVRGVMRKLYGFTPEELADRR